MNVLPRVESMRTYRRLFARDAVWGPAMRTICARHGLDATGLRRSDLGSHIVFFSGDRIIKLFCPVWPEDARAERAVLRADVPGVPMPELVAEGELEGWPYVVISVVEGVAALRVWKELDAAARLDVVGQIGELMRALHRTPPIEALDTDWDAFLSERRARIDAHHGDAGDAWLRRIHDRVDTFAPRAFEPVVLSADITEDHVLLTEIDGRWTITGFIDFGDAMMGDPHYDFIAPLAFFTNGNPALSRRLLEAYGWTLDRGLAERLTTYCLLHKYGHIGQLLERAPADDMDAFHRGMWGTV